METYTVNEIRETTADMAREMIAKMMLRANKGHYKDYSLEQLRTRVCEEVIELIESVDRGRVDAIQGECVDVANVAMMLWDRLRGVTDASELKSR
jgi:NTP pyrophosphatase (non-canonical NTP hydrolase)